MAFHISININKEHIMNQKVPYNDLPTLPSDFQVNAQTGFKCGNARAALAELKGAVNMIPNPSVLINNIPLLETHSSNKIENIVTTQDNLFRFNTSDHRADPPTKEALRYRTALRHAINKPINTPLIKEICSTIKNEAMQFRSENVMNTTKKIERVTCIVNRATGKAIYTPPDDPHIIQKLMKDWVGFSNKTNTDPLIQMAMLHYQFEAIHPFKDGNGRTGRILNLLFLIQKKLLDSPVLYLSRYILENRDDYYNLLRKVTEDNSWNEWINYMLDAVEQTSIWTLNHIHAIKKLMDHTKQYLKKHLKTPYYRGLLLEVLFTYPYCRSSDLQKLGIQSSITSRKYLRKLVHLGILQEEKIGKELLFIHSKYLQLLMDSNHQFNPYN